MSKEITKETAPPGSRWLLRGTGYGSGILEATILEWSPSGQAVLLKYRSGSEHWTEDMPIGMERLDVAESATPPIVTVSHGPMDIFTAISPDWCVPCNAAHPVSDGHFKQQEASSCP